MAVAKNGSSKFGTVSIGVDSKSRYHVFAGVDSSARLGNRVIQREQIPRAAVASGLWQDEIQLLVFGEGTHIHGSCSLQIGELGLVRRGYGVGARCRRGDPMRELCR